jgi:hypothetical protein
MDVAQLERLEAGLAPLVAAPGAPAAAREDALAFNRDLDDVRATLLEPARAELARGGASRELRERLERTIVELAFWRRVLVRVHAGALGPDGPRPEILVRYLLV